MSVPPGQLRVHFAGLRLRYESPQGQVYTGTDINGTAVTIAVLGEALAVQPSIRNAFADVVWRHSVGSEPGRVTVYAADLHAARPWAAIRHWSGQPGAEQLFAALADAAPTAAVPTTLVPPPPPPLPHAAHQAPAAPAAAWRRSPGPWALGATCAVLVVGLLVVATIVGLRVLRDDDRPVGQPTGPPAPPTESTEPTGSPGPEPTGEASGQPTLRDAEPVSLVGPTFAPDEDTYTMAFSGWPFAFRAPNDWTCANGVTSSSRIEGEVKACFSQEVEGGVVLWECRADCDEAEQQEKRDIWFADEPGQPVPWGDSPPTHYVETEENEDGRYVINLVRFFGAGSAEPRWLVGLTFESAPVGVEGMQKVVNDILSQTS